MIESLWDCLDKGDVVLGGLMVSIGVFLHKFIWSKSVSKEECKRVHELGLVELEEIKEDIRMLIRRLIDPNYKNNKSSE